jgi:hypothetical protein
LSDQEVLDQLILGLAGTIGRREVFTYAIWPARYSIGIDRRYLEPVARLVRLCQHTQRLSFDHGHQSTNYLDEHPRDVHDRRPNVCRGAERLPSRMGGVRARSHDREPE